MSWCLASAQGTGNPFANHKFYVNPVNSKEFDTSIATASGKTRENLQRMQSTPSAYWIDTKDKIRGTSPTCVEGILRDAASKPTPELVVFMWYDLPNRDCDAKASNGEICCAKLSDGRCDYMHPGDCADGIQEYKSEYVDPFVSVLQEYDGKVPIVLVMEPDGLANLATNIAHPHCGNMATQTAYKEGVKYAVSQLATHAPSVAIYLDAAHGGWLGWENNLEDFMKMLKGLDMPVDKIRGFATNVANYQALGVQCPWCPDQGTRNGYCLNGKHKNDPCCADPCALLSQWNFGNNELNYAAGLVAAARVALGMDAHVIIDTGRNGVTDQRQDCANWCNPRGAGTGVPSTTKTANTSLVDAYFWLKTPGESDGCSQTLPDGKQCPRFDSKCSSVDSLGTKPGEPHAPEAGRWFDYQVKQLAANAQFDPPPAKDMDSAACPSTGSGPSFPSSSGGSSWGGFTPTASVGGVAAGSGGQCASAYQQCGGSGWTGATCCEDGCSCTGRGGYYSQCVPSGNSGTCSAGAPNTGNSGVSAVGGNARPAGGLTTGSNTGTSGFAPMMPVTPAPRPQGPFSWLPWLSPALAPAPVVPAVVPYPVATAAPTVAPTMASTGFAPMVPAGVAPMVPAAVAPMVPAPVAPTASVASAPAASTPQIGHCNVPYGQCGGNGWSGPTCCDEYCTCQFISADRSECVPVSTGPAYAGAVPIIMKDADEGSVEPNAHLHGIVTNTFVWAVVPISCGLFALVAMRWHRLRSERGRLPAAFHSWLPTHRREEVTEPAEHASLTVEVA